MNEWERRSHLAEMLRKRFPKGTVVQLCSMEGETSMPDGLIGTVELVDDIGQIHVKWENGSRLALDVEKDSFTVLRTPKKDRGMSR